MANINRTKSFAFIKMNPTTTLSPYNNNKTGLFIDETTNNSEPLQLVERLTTHITLIVTIIGLIGNAGTIVVLNRQSMRKWRSSMLLTALAAVDFLYLLIIFLSILDTLTNQTIGLHRSLIFCQVTVYITHVCSFLSASFTLSFTLQRFVAVLFPLHANTIISARSSMINILVLICFGCGFYSFSFFVTNLSQGQCQEDETYPVLYPLLIVDTCLTFVLPFICILLFNCAIVYKIRTRNRFDGVFEGSLSISMNSNKRRKSNNHHLPENDLYHERQRLHQSNSINNYTPLKNGSNTSNSITSSHQKMSKSGVEFTTTTTTTSGNGYLSRLSHPRLSTVTVSNELTPVAPSISNPNRQGISQRTTKMLVICSTTFLLFNSPYCAVLLYCIISKVVLRRTLSILRHFYFMSFCLNFFLYSLCGHRFRHELILLFKTCCRKWRSENLRSKWFRIEKFPPQHSFTRVINRSNV